MLPVKMITFDIEQALSLHELIAEKLHAKTYFTRPYTSQDKGTIENRTELSSCYFQRKPIFFPYQTKKSKE